MQHEAGLVGGDVQVTIGTRDLLLGGDVIEEIGGKKIQSMDEVIAAVDESTDVCVVGMLDSLSVKNTKLGLETLELMGYDPERVRLVLNRADTNVGITHNDVVTIIGRPPDVLVPSDREITRSVNGGTPIALSAKRSEAAKAFIASTPCSRSFTRTSAPLRRSARGTARSHLRASACICS